MRNIYSRHTGELGYDGLNGTRKIGSSYTYDTYLICMGLGPSILSVIEKSLSYSGPSYPSSPVFIRIPDELIATDPGSQSELNSVPKNA